MRKLVLMVVGLMLLSSALAGSQMPNCTGYTYAGIQGITRAYGIAADIVMRSSPQLDNNQSSHSVAWIGLNSERERWIQVGIATVGNEEDRFYYEIGNPKLESGYFVTFLGKVEVGDSHRVTLLATASQPDSWRVWINGRPVSPVIRLPNFSWRMTYVGAENRRSDSGCNEFSYEFGNVRIAKVPGGVWRPLKRYSLRKDVPYQISFTDSNSFIASYP